MRILFVASRYESGPIETQVFCRELAMSLSQRGHRIEILTGSSPNGPVGSESDPERAQGRGNPTTVHRLAVTTAADPLLDVVDRSVLAGHVPSLAQQEVWVSGQGQVMPDLVRWLTPRCADFDVIVFVGYCVHTTWAGLRTVAGRVATVLHPLADDGPHFRLPVFDTLFHLPTAYAFVGPSEVNLVARRLAGRPEGVMLGWKPDSPIQTNAATFKAAFGLDGRQYVVARPGRSLSGLQQLVRFFLVYKARSGANLAMAVLGPTIPELARSGDLVFTGTAGPAIRAGAISGAVGLIEPGIGATSSANLVEAWSQARPVLVDGASLVLGNEVRRSEGGVPYEGYAEFEASLDLLVGDSSIAARLGQSGRRYVEATYDWDRLLARYERLLTVIQARP